ncbi:MAG: tail fiber protein [Acidovorax sp.]
MPSLRPLCAALLAGAAVLPAYAGSSPYVGELMMFGGNFCPAGWLMADGSVLSVNQYSTLYAVLGTAYGGDGQATFNLPNLQGRAPVGQGQGRGLSPIALGDTGGAEAVTLTIGQMPAHNHGTATANAATTATPATGRVLAQAQNAGAYAPAGGATVALGATGMTGMTGIAGGSLPVDVRNPYLGLVWCVATDVVGAFPSP